MKRIRNLRFPERFQGSLNTRHYFEGWYFKVVSPAKEAIFAIIPGIALNRKEGTSHAFVQVLDGVGVKYHYLRFPLESFTYSRDSFAVRVDCNSFSSNGLTVDLQSEDISIVGELSLSELTPIPKRPFRPGIMGPFTFFPFMQTYHGIVSMNHTLTGSLIIDEHKIDFTGGKGYIEKDWGRSFPSHWIWLQSNHFEEPARSIMFSVAKIPYLGLTFQGFLLSLWDRGEFKIMSTYTGAKIRSLKVSKDDVRIHIEDRKNIVEIHGKKAVMLDPSLEDDSVVMMTPAKGTMVSKCIESMRSIVEVKFWQKSGKSKELLFSDTGSAAGLEIMGTTEHFL